MLIGFRRNLSQMIFVYLINRSAKKAPKKAVGIAMSPNRVNTYLSTFLPVRRNFIILFRKCTIAVKVIARSTGKKIANIGISKVPSPKPEKKDRSDATRETTATKIYSMIKLSQFSIDLKI